MSQEIAVIGTAEFTTGFRLAGVREFRNVPEEEKPEDLDAAVEDVLDTDGVGIIVMHADDLDYLSRSVRETVETSVEPTFVTIGGGVGGSTGMREQIKRAIGIDLMATDESANE